MKRKLLILAFLFGLLGNTFAQKELNNQINVYCSYPFQLTQHNSIDKWRSNGQYHLGFSKKVFKKFYLGLESGIGIYDIIYKPEIRNDYKENNPDMIFCDLKVVFNYLINIHEKYSVVPSFNIGVSRIFMQKGLHSFASIAYRKCAAVGLDFKRKIFDKFDIGFHVRYQMVFHDFTIYTDYWHFPANITNNGDKYFKNIETGIYIGYKF